MLALALLLGCGASAPDGEAVTSDASSPVAPAASRDVSSFSPVPDGPVGPYLEPEHAVALAIASSRAASSADSASSASNEIIFVTEEMPLSLNSWGVDCVGGVASAVCADIVSDPLTWFDSSSFELVPLTGIESWSQRTPERWRFTLREGVTFHNGEDWNANAAKKGLDYLGDEATSGNGAYSFGLHGPIESEVIDDFTIDVICQAACPIFPRTSIYATFQAPEWWDGASQDERAATTVGLGPYRIAGYEPGVEVQLEAYEKYRPGEGVDSQAPVVRNARQVWLTEPLARAALVGTGEAHWAEDIGFQNTWAVPVAVTGGTNEVLTLVADNIWHPELRKKGVREALALAIDCEALMEFLYDGLQQCIGNISQWGTVGINENNFEPYGYNPDRARELLSSNDYDPENVIRIHTRLDRVYRALALFETVATMWEDVGVNAEVVVLDPASARDYRLSGCGQFEGGLAQLKCAEEAPPPPIEASTHFVETVTSNQVLDMQRQLLLRASCHSVNSRVCNLVPGLEGMTFQESISDAIGTPMGPERTRKMERLAQIIHDEYWFLPFFVAAESYGLAKNLDWEPRFDSRLRLNTMSFSE